ncbi:RNA-binding protein 28-like [Amphibalanus amphitrite]|uniref:RNA-binding protein 28-like n=1 Tax=Amphibalanus amphitrite TaxID=1232801 RepID=UPI001C926CD5|nr:RNA-binding protein 28-like [Amphibalanus amphitrite]XP_043205264.1 RNA-binding protein 28-like [Amphibalanus amphitrite]XP_043205265.1 RNA-binding protein 28-like [Amphibalanus amphitrite]XP_043205267.1 RNA-binding protein 28-like [Amphibalanus amphitrite]XP_043205268.1 RNA-binding protein 28-like [Amphibalanus amphitrite]XP_043205269.1 RNA-binding protein 28-like [Amphibalanus amphitrite]XP_043205270.1 RNA-binding protein 28-like [Amphibalanus amphitrite]XP_043205271.1 RNA-binding prote
MTPQIKSSTLYVGNLPVDATRTEVEEIFGEAGPIKKCFVLKAKNEASSYAFVTYALPEDTDTAAAELQNATVRGNHLTVSISNRKQKQSRAAKEGSGHPAGSDQHTPSKEPVRKKQKTDSGAAAVKSSPPKKKKSPDAKEDAHAAAPNKKGRLIVRNLSFKVTDDSFRKHFASVGPVTEVKLLKKSNGLLVGCGFVQFKHEKHAQEAIKKYNTKPFLGRPIVIDWAVDKTRYEAAQKPAQTGGSKGSKRPLDDEEDVEDEDEEEEDEGSDDDGSSHDETMNSSPGKASVDQETPEEEDSEEDEESGDDEEEDGDDAETGESDAASDEDEEGSDDDDKSDESDAEEESEENEGSDVEEEAATPAKRNRKVASDVGEGCTLFIKNLSFDTDQDTLKELFSQFGRVKYALLCVDPLTEHPRGTAFVQFKSAEEAEAARTAAVSPDNAALFTLDDRRIEVLPAVNKDQLRRKGELEKEKASEGKDKRNLYLAREGLVREGSRAAEGVSRADINKRIGLEKWKTKMLRNLGMFVSPVRLCVHNLPVDWDDGRLRKLFQQHAPAGAQITEARVMRDRRDVSSHPRGQSKEYGFVTFTQHEASLAALRNINNNPEIFTVNRRPIVEFAVENRAALDARRKREEKSRQMNQPVAPAALSRRARKAAKSAPSAATPAAPASAAQPARPAHAGMAADPSNKRLPKLKSRAGAQESAKAITRKMLKADKKGRRERAGHKKDVVQDWERTPAEKQQKKKPSRRERKAEKGRGKERPEDAKFTNLVDKYRKKLAAAPATASPWFQ